MSPEYSKAWAAALMAFLTLLELYFGVNIFGANAEQAVLTILAIATPVVVWLVPNWKPNPRR